MLSPRGHLTGGVIEIRIKSGGNRKYYPQMNVYRLGTSSSDPQPLPLMHIVEVWCLNWRLQVGMRLHGNCLIFVYVTRIVAGEVGESLQYFADIHDVVFCALSGDWFVAPYDSWLGGMEYFW